jgi:hypothetical protein
MDRKLWDPWRRFKSDIALKVSGAPSHESYSWGPKRSWTAWSLYHFIFLLRLLSPLQWWKFYKRISYRPVLHSTLDAKVRPDFHAADSERYLQLVLIGAGLACFLRRKLYLATAALFPHSVVPVCWIGWLILLVFLVESIQWTFYYALFRPLMERAKLNLYDEAEYLIMFPVVILTQLLLLATLWDKGLEQTALLMLNVSDPSAGTAAAAVSAFPMSLRAQSLFAALLGQSYIVIVIASLIRVVPTLHVRKRPNITVIGYGDVARIRILPALLAVYHPRQLAVASDYLSAHEQDELREMHIDCVFSACNSKRERDSGKVDVISKIVEWADAHSKFAIVAVPTPVHLDYVLRLADRGIRLALEKPIVGTQAELDLLKSRSSGQLFADIFVLSYYWLEKGLSLNYLLTLNPRYRPLLDCDPEMSMQEIAQAVGQLGELKDLTVEFLEGSESRQRYWSELLANGGMVMETLVHPMTFVVNFARFAKAYPAEKGLWSGTPSVQWNRNQGRAADILTLKHKQIGPTSAEIHGSLANGATVNLRCGKYIIGKGQESRFLIASFERGWITCDLSKKKTRVLLRREAATETVLTISNLTLLKSQTMRRSQTEKHLKYQHQIDLMNSFFADGWGGLRFDDYPSQLDVLQELTNLSLTIPAEESIEPDEAAQYSPWLKEAWMADPSGFQPALCHR